LNWILRYRLRRFLSSSVWIVPLGSMLVAVLLLQVLRWIDHALVPPVLGFGIEGARNVLTMIAASMLSLLVFAFSALLITVQLASAQLTPRVIAGLAISGRPVKYTIGLVMLTYTLAIGVLGRSETVVLQLATALCILLSLVSIAVFLYLMDYWIKALRPVSVMAVVGAEAGQAIDEVYPYPLLSAPGADRKPVRPLAGAVTLLHEGHSGVLLAADLIGLSRRAMAVSGIIELVPRIGDYIATGEPLFRLYDGAVRLAADTLNRDLAFGPERTIQQDPMFAFRILVDIAIKALSPAINDPTTAVLALDQLDRLLRRIGQRRLDTEAILDERGEHGVLFRTPDWDEYVMLATSEIRNFGATSLLVVQRLHDMLINLIAVLPASRRPALETQLRLLDAAATRVFPDVEDRMFAGIVAPAGAASATAEEAPGKTG
jgi:uncharacterized membrane protein